MQGGDWHESILMLLGTQSSTASPIWFYSERGLEIENGKAIYSLGCFVDFVSAINGTISGFCYGWPPASLMTASLGVSRKLAGFCAFLGLVSKLVVVETPVWARVAVSLLAEPVDFPFT